MACFTHNSNKIHFDVHGRGRDLLFMHGLGSDRRQAKQALEGLANHRLIIVDMPGHGESEFTQAYPLKGQAGFAPYAEIATALLAHLGVQRIIVGGISMGAGIALRLAIDEPSLVSAMLLVRPAWLDRPGRPHLNIIAEIGAWIREAGTDHAAAQLAAHPVYEAALAENPLWAASIMGAIKRPQALEAAAVLGALVADQPIARIAKLSKCTIPALVIGNNADPLHPAMIARELCGALGAGEYFHAPPKYLDPRRHSAAVVDSIARFLNQHRYGADAAMTHSN